jgi:fatty-acyl-CoA synthase
VIVEGDMAEAYESACELIDCAMTPWVSDGGQAKAPGGKDFDAALSGQSDVRPDRSYRAQFTAKDPCMKMYTSGTTGLPKAAIVAHTRALYYLQVFGVSGHATKDDRMMMVLPMYHATGGYAGSARRFRSAAL